MEDNKYNRFYADKPVSDLLERLRNYYKTGSGIDEDWLNALKIHVSERPLSPEETKEFEAMVAKDPIKSTASSGVKAEFNFPKGKTEIDLLTEIAESTKSTNSYIAWLFWITVISAIVSVAFLSGAFSNAFK